MLYSNDLFHMLIHFVGPPPIDCPYAFTSENIGMPMGINKVFKEALDTPCYEKLDQSIIPVVFVLCFIGFWVLTFWV